MPRCPELSPEDDSVDNRVTNISYSSAPILAGTVATYTCVDGVVDNANTRTCGCNGELSAEPECRDGRIDIIYTSFYSCMVIIIGASE